MNVHFKTLRIFIIILEPYQRGDRKFVGIKGKGENNKNMTCRVHSGS